MKFKNYLNEEKFKVGDFVMQKQSDYNVYALLISPLKNGGFKSLAINDDPDSRPIVATKSTKNWNPQPTIIKEKDVPEKLLKKIMDKKKKMGL